MTVEWLQPLQQQAGAADLPLPVLFWRLHGEDRDQLPPWMFWTYLGISIGLVTMAGLMSGLTLGLMSLDELDLEVLKRSGTEQEKMHARRIMPVISNEHFLLVTLLLFNALSTEALPIFLDKLVDPVTAVLLSVTVVLVIGEILPQAVCRSYGLQVGSYSALFVRLLMFVSAPITWPIGKLLDWLLGDEQTALFRRAQLKALVGLHSSAEGLGGNLSADEISIITGALDLTSKTACTAMTPLDKVFMLPSDRRLDESTLQDVLVSGHSRVPVHEPGNRRRLLGLILVKELVLVDPEEGLTAGQLVGRSLPRLPANIPMYQLLRLFEAGGSHMVALTCPKVPRTFDSNGTPAAAAAAVPVPSQPPAAAAAGNLSRSSSASGTLPHSGLHRIKSGVIKAGEKEVYFEAEQRLPVTTPTGSWGTAGYWAQQPGSSGNSGTAVIGSPVGAQAQQQQQLRDSSAGEGCVGIWGPEVQEGDPVGIITIEDVIEELLQQEIIDETDQYVDNMQVTRVDAYNLTTSLPPRLRKAYAQQFTPRVGRLVVHHPSHHHGSAGTGSWRGLTELKQQQIAPRGAYSNPTTPLAGTPLAGSPDDSSWASPKAALAAFSSSSSHVYPPAAAAAGAAPAHSRLSSESHHSQQHLVHMEQLPEQQQVQLGVPAPLPALLSRNGSTEAAAGVHIPNAGGHGPRQAAVHLPTRTHQHQHHLLNAAALLRHTNNAADGAPGASAASVARPGGGGGAAAAAAGGGGAAVEGPHSSGAGTLPLAGSSGSGSGSSLLNRTLLQRQPQLLQPPQPPLQQQGMASLSAVAAATNNQAASGGVPTRGISQAHSGGSSSSRRGGVAQGGSVGAGGGGVGARGAAGFGSVVEVADSLQQPLLASCEVAGGGSSSSSSSDNDDG